MDNLHENKFELIFEETAANLSISEKNKTIRDSIALVNESDSDCSECTPGK